MGQQRRTLTKAQMQKMKFVTTHLRPSQPQLKLFLPWYATKHTTRWLPCTMTTSISTCVVQPSQFAVSQSIATCPCPGFTTPQLPSSSRTFAVGQSLSTYQPVINQSPSTSQPAAISYSASPSQPFPISQAPSPSQQFSFSKSPSSSQEVQTMQCAPVKPRKNTAVLPASAIESTKLVPAAQTLL